MPVFGIKIPNTHWMISKVLRAIQTINEYIRFSLEDLIHFEYCPFKVRGEFLYDNEFTVGPRSLIINGQGATEKKGNLISGHSLNRGYNIITPFKVEDRK